MRNHSELKMSQTSAPSNIALIKYWGKRDNALNLPLTSSYSVSLTQMRSFTTVKEASRDEDTWDIYGDPSKAQRVLAAARQDTENTCPLAIKIRNNFPSGAGLASSASSMASFAMALNDFLADGSCTTQQVSTWARLGSGSSVRSFHSGYVLWNAGKRPKGEDCIAETYLPSSHMPLALIVCVVDHQPKPIGSTKAMQISRQTSPLYQGFHDQNNTSLAQALEATHQKDISRLGQLSEENCQSMHAVMRASTPTIDYFLPGTHESIQLVKSLRSEGFSCFYTIDAGPNVKIFCPPDQQEPLLKACKKRLQHVSSFLKDSILTTISTNDKGMQA